jgi:hypothetical protein
MTRQRTIAAAMLLAVLAAAPALARPLPPKAPAARVHDRILDGCVMSSAGTPLASHPVPKCRCYAAGVVRAMSDGELRRYLRTGTISDALHDRAEHIYAKCG